MVFRFWFFELRVWWFKGLGFRVFDEGILIMRFIVVIFNVGGYCCFECYNDVVVD